MSETQEASVGYYGEVHLHDGTSLYELVQVKSFGLPSQERDRVETTHLKSPGWRRQYTSTFFADSEFEAVLNFRPLSTTNQVLNAAVASGETRACKLVIPEDGVPVAQILCTVKVTGKDDGEMSIDGVMESTATFLIQTVDEIEEYVA
jgi:hypothetical protein